MTAKQAVWASWTLLGLISSGCSTGVWVKSVLSTYPGDVNMAMYECQRDSYPITAVGPSGLTTINSNVSFSACMEAKGFYEQAPVP